MSAEQNPLAQIGGFFQNALRTARQHPVAVNAQKALSRFRAEDTEEARYARLPPRIVSLPRHLAAIIPGDSTAELVLTNGLNNFLALYNTALICRLVLTWFPNPPEFIVTPLSTVCDPYLNLFRGLIPPLGGSLDLSPILAFVVLNLFTNTAAALPCEVPGRAKPAAAAAPLASLSAAVSAARWAQPAVSRSEALYRRRVAASQQQWAAARALSA